MFCLVEHTDKQGMLEATRVVPNQVVEALVRQEEFHSLQKGQDHTTLSAM